MKIRNIIFSLLSVFGAAMADDADKPHLNVSTDKSVSFLAFSKMTPKEKAQQLPSELLEEIKTKIEEQAGRKSIDGITAEMCDDEIKRRQDAPGDFPATVSPDMLSLEILNIIAHSPRTIAGIDPQQALEEEQARIQAYPTEMAGFVMNELAFKSINQRAIDEWDQNEMEESVRKFMDDLNESNEPGAQKTFELLKAGAEKYAEKESLDTKLDRARRGEVDKPIYIDEEAQLAMSTEEIEKRKQELKERGVIPDDAKSKNIIEIIKNYFQTNK